MRFFAALLLLTVLFLPVEIAQAFELKILYINDYHSHLRADTGMDLMLGGKKTRTTVGGFPRVVAAFKKLSDGNENVLKLHAGDAITGDLYYTLFKGEADAALMNEVCFDAFSLGNHEFDDGTEASRPSSISWPPAIAPRRWSPPTWCPRSASRR